MRNPFVLALLSSAILASGCTTKVPEVGLTQSASHYDDRMLDSLGSQRYTEQQMLYMRKIQTLEHELNALEDKRKALESSMTVNQLEAGAGKLQASDSEAERISDFASATHESQTRIAQEKAEYAVQQSLIENERDRLLMEADIEANRRLAELDQRYADSMQSETSEADRARLESDLEIEKAKARARQKRAQIEAESASDLSRLDQNYQSRISDARKTAVAYSQAASQESQAQRIKVALATAEAQRRLKDDISAAKVQLTSLLSEKKSATQSLQDEISKLNEQIIALQGRMNVVESGYDSKIALQQSLLDDLLGKSEQLADVERTLISTPAQSVGQPISDVSSAEVQRLEQELQRAKGDLLVNKSTRLAQVDEQLAHELSELSVNLNKRLTSIPNAGNEVTARIEKSSSESEIRAGLAVKRTEINNEARSKLAELTVKTEIAKAGVVAPVVTSRAVYSGSYGDKPVAFAARDTGSARELVASAKNEAKALAPKRTESKDKTSSEAVAPLVVAASFEPSPIRPKPNQVSDVVISSGVMAGGDVKPLVVAPSVTTYSVVYRYAEKGSADKFMAYLKAYGIEDFSYTFSEKLGQHILFMGKYTSKDQAASRVSFLNKTTSTSNAQIVEADL